MEVTTERTKIKFKSGKEIELTQEELQELKDYYTTINTVFVDRIVQSPLIDPYPAWPNYPPWSPTWCGSKTDSTFQFNQD